MKFSPAQCLTRTYQAKPKDLPENDDLKHLEESIVLLSLKLRWLGWVECVQISTANVSVDNSCYFMYRGIYPSSRIDSFRAIQNFSFLGLSCPWHTFQAIDSVNLRLKMKKSNIEVNYCLFCFRSVSPGQCFD